MPFIRVSKKNWGEAPREFVAVEVLEPAGHRGPNITLPSGVTLYNAGREVFATEAEALGNTKSRERRAVEQAVAA
jgi:hypothetical protein